MEARITRLEADVAIAGAGPGGCTVARELARRGRKVILLEKGSNDTRFFGTPLGTLLHIETERSPHLIRRTVEGDDLIIGRGVGGGTLLYAGAAFMPDAGYWQRHGIEIAQEIVDEAVQECHVCETPEEFIGEGTRRLWDAARDLDLGWEKLGRFVDFSRCTPGCDECTEGCARGAKWTAAAYAGEAESDGASLITRAQVRKVTVEDGTATGVVAERGPDRYEIGARAVVCCAGAVGTARILGRSGLHGAGSWLFGDPTVISVGFLASGKGNGLEHYMPVGQHEHETGCTFAACLQPWIGWHVQMVQAEGPRALLHLHRFSRAMGVFCKVADEGVGSVDPDGRVSKTYTLRDRSRREHGLRTAERILVKAGCDPHDIHHGRTTLGHPGGTVRVGRLLDENLQTPIENLYCCDTSVFPEAPGIPPALTIVVLAKRLARRLDTLL